MTFVVVVVGIYIVVCGVAHMEVWRFVDVQLCCVSGALHLLQCQQLTQCLSIIVIVGTYSQNLRAQCWQ